ncbi:hypothetical protein [Halococcus saccharolyticus]|uniref:Peptide ABC transporter ATP-binding protein n=1 Tax=Halococcus saccharolyticus DSM 5350 TaxID=1227455 RepID=M0MQ70_9EURY|nr:hypothetical protein [Halococcus saccharolyticus]EMA47872.1 hypothetical protein C449_00330 [Halococcus saccharolyticus DSM 5350]
MDASRALATIADEDLAPLDVSADLAVSIDGHEVTIESATDRLHVAVPTVGVAAALVRRARDVLPGAARVLATADLTAVVRVRGTVVAVLGAEARPSRLGERLDAPLQVSADGAFTATIREALSTL